MPLPVIVNARQRRRPAPQNPQSCRDMDTTTDTRLVRHVVVTAILAAAAVVVAWDVLFTGPGMGVNRYTPGRVISTGVGGPAMQTPPWPTARVVSIQQDPLRTGVTHAQYRRNTRVPR